MRKFLFFAFLIISTTASAQWTIINGKQRFAKGLGLPTLDTVHTELINDTSQMVLRPQDSSLWWRYRGKWRTFTGSGGGISGITANNGLTANTTTNVQLGGTLLKPTTINSAGFPMTITGDVDPSQLASLNIYNSNSASSSVGLFVQSVGGGVVAQTTNNNAITGTSTNAAGVKGISTNNYGIVSVALGSTYAGSFESRYNSDFNTIQPVLKLSRLSYGSTPLNGIGSAIDLCQVTADGTNNLSASIATKWNNVALASRSSDIELYNVHNAIYGRKLALNSLGKLTLDKYGVGSFTGTSAYSLNVDASGNIIEAALPTAGVTSVATGYGLSGGTITNTGTLIADTATLSIKYLRRADTSNLVATKTNLNLKVNYTDTATMLLPYLFGSGTANYVPKFTDTRKLAISQIYDNGTSVGIGTASPNASYRLDVNGIINTNNAVNISTNGAKTGFYGNANSMDIWAGNNRIANYGLVGVGGSVYDHFHGLNFGGGLSGNVNSMRIASNIVPNGVNTIEFTQLLINPQYNQSPVGGSGTGNLRGIYYNPLVTSLNGSAHIAYENTSGDIIHGNLAGTGSRMVTADANGKLGVATIPTGTVTSVATNYGLSGGTITNAGTISVDSATLSNTYFRRADTAVNVATKNNVAAKVNISDTASMLTNYAKLNQITLDRALTNGNTSTNTLTIQNVSGNNIVKLQSNEMIVEDLAYKGEYFGNGFFSTNKNTGNYYRLLGTGPNNYNNQTLLLPKIGGTLVTRVNGTLADSSGNVTISSGSGTVTSVATGYGLSGGTITNTGTLLVDSATLSTKYLRIVDTTGKWASATGYIPYVGATTDVDLGTHKLSAQSLQVEGTAGNGHIDLKHQSANATATGSSTALFADVNGDLKYKNAGNFYTTLKTSGNAADAVYTYPSATTTLIGAGDTSVFARKSLSAYTVMANNTNATANATAQTFKDLGNQTYTGTINWTGTTPPSGTTNHKYRWSQVGKTVTVTFSINYATAGTLLTAVKLTLPTDMPTPTNLGTLTGANDVLSSSWGYLGTSTAAVATGRTTLNNNVGNNGFEFNIVAAGTNAKTAGFTLTYFTD